MMNYACDISQSETENYLNECNNSCYNLFKDEDETMKNETQQFLLQDIKNCMERCLCFLLIRVMKYIKCKPLPCLLVQSNLLIRKLSWGP